MNLQVCSELIRFMELALKAIVGIAIFWLQIPERFYISAGILINTFLSYHLRPLFHLLKKPTHSIARQTLTNHVHLITLLFVWNARKICDFSTHGEKIILCCGEVSRKSNGF